MDKYEALSKPVARCISKLSNQIRRRIDALASKDEFSGAQGRVLHFILSQPEELFQRDVEEEFGLRPPTATEILKKMEQNGLIRREPTAYDARLKQIIVSEKAMQYQKPVMDGLMQLEEDLTEGISKEELAVFLQVVEKMTENMERAGMQQP